MQFDWDGAFWELKRFFPGDPDFTLDNFFRLPYEYVLAAYYKMGVMRMNELHLYEQPIAVQTMLQANANRDPKARKKPFEASDFFCFQPAELQDKPATRYGAAYMKLIEDRELPAWALFCFSAMSNESADSAPSPHYLRGNGVILLAPTWDESGIKGMLIATERKQGPMELEDSSGVTHLVVVPEVNTKVIAQEDAELRILR